MENIKKLYRSRTSKIFGGVCGGLGKYWEVDPLTIRLVTALVSVFFCFLFIPFLITYLVMWMSVPKEPKVTTEVPPTNA